MRALRALRWSQNLDKVEALKADAVVIPIHA